MKRLEYMASGGENNFSNTLLIGKDILAVYKDGIGSSKIISGGGVLLNKEAGYRNPTGNISFANTFERGEKAIVLYQDGNIEDICIEPLLRPGPGLPDATVGVPYSASLFVDGTIPFILSAIVKPSWMTIGVSGNNINFSGMPVSGDTGTDIEVSFMVTNCGGAKSFSDTIDVIEIISPATVEVTGTIGISARGIFINLSQSVNCNVDFYLNGVADDGGPVGFSATVTVPAGFSYKNQTNAVSAPAVITCIDANVAPDTYEISSPVCGGIIYHFTLKINSPC